MDQKTRARIQMTVNMRDIFDAQHYSFRYRLRLRGVEINSERIQYVKQILAERGLVVRAEGLGSPLPAGSRVGEREWLLMADRAVQGDRLILTSLVSCDTRQVMRRDESARTVIQGEDIRANTVIDVLGVLRGRREELMNEVNAYVRELRHQLGRFSAFD